MNERPLTKQKRFGRLARLGLGVAVVLSVPFVLGAVILTTRLVTLPKAAGHLAAARLSCAAMFSFGLSIGIIGSALALISPLSHRRMLGCAAALFGCANIALGFMIRRYIEGTITSVTPSTIQVVIPLGLWISSVWLAIRAAKMESSQSDQPEPTLEEQPQPQPLS